MQVTDIVIPLLFLAVLGGMAWWLTAGKKRGHTTRSRLASANGWKYEAGSGLYKLGDDIQQSNILYRLSGSLPDGRAWVLEARMRMEIDLTGMNEQTVWQMPYGYMTVLLTQRSSVPIPKEMKTAVLRKNGIDIDAGSLDIVEIAGLSTPFDPYEAYADKSDQARVGLERASVYLAHFSATQALPSVSITPGNTVVRLPICLEKPADMEAMVRLGLSLC